MRYDDDGKAFLELEDEFFNFAGGNGIEGGAGLIHEKNFGLDSQGARNAEALLLASGEAGAGLLVHLVFYFVPEGGQLQRALDNLLQRLRSLKPFSFNPAATLS